MVEDLWQFHYFHSFCFGIALVKDKWYLASVLARPCWYLSVFEKKYQHTSNDLLSAMSVFVFLLFFFFLFFFFFFCFFFFFFFFFFLFLLSDHGRSDGRTDGQMDSQGDYRTLFQNQPFNRSTFLRVVHYSQRFESYGDYHIFTFLPRRGYLRIKKSGIWKLKWLSFVDMYPHAKTLSNYSYRFKSYSVFHNLITDGRTWWL